MPAPLKKLLFLLLVLFCLTVSGLYAFFTGWLSSREEIRIGENVARQYEKEYGAEENPWVSQTGTKMIPFTLRSDLSYRFRVLKTKEINAMAIMGGFIYINRGLLDLINGNEDELAFVLGHEMAHVAQRHMVKNVEKSISGGLILQLVFGGSSELTQQLVAIAWNLTQLGYSREEEYQADHLGVSYLIKASYKPKAALSLMEKMKKAGGGDGMEFLMSHPIMDKRMERIKADYPSYFTP